MAIAAPYSKAHSALTTGTAIDTSSGGLNIDSVGQDGSEWVIQLRPSGGAIRVGRASATVTDLALYIADGESRTLPDTVRRSDISPFRLYGVGGTVTVAVSAMQVVK